MSKVANFFKFSWFFNNMRKIRILYLIIFIMLVAQLVLSAVLFLHLEKLNNSFIDYRETSMRRINQIYGQVYSLSARLENKK